jgi:transposase-like protein
MRSQKKRRVFDAAFRAKVALAAAKGDQSLSQLSARFGVHATQIANWRRELLERAPELFADRRGATSVQPDVDPQPLYAEIGRLRMELDWLKKKAGPFDE